MFYVLDHICKFNGIHINLFELINLNIDSFLNLRISKNTHCVNFLMVSPTENKLKLQKLQQKMSKNVKV